MDFEDMVIGGLAIVSVGLIGLSIALCIARTHTEPEVVIRKDSVMIYFDERIQARPVYVNNEKVWETKK